MYSDLTRLLNERKPQHSLPARFYAGTDVFAADIDVIFGHEWVFAGVTASIRESGCFFTLEIGDTSIIVLRDQGNEIRAFHNTCRHRGSRIIDEASGRATRLVCPYHCWTYDISGNLLHANRMPERFDRSEHGLRPVHTAVVAGTIYICLADIPPDISTFRSMMERKLGQQNLAGAKVAHQSDVVTKGNWKLVMENARECLHCANAHPELMRSLEDNYPYGNPRSDPRIDSFWNRCQEAGIDPELEGAPGYRAVRLPLKGAAKSISMDGQRCVKRSLGKAPPIDIGSLRWVRYPNTFNHALEDYAVIIRVLPIGPEETLVTTTWLVDADAEEGTDYCVDELAQLWSVTNAQDQELIERNQAGVKSRGYLPGPYSETAEAGVCEFVDWYCDRHYRALNNADGRAA